MYKSFIGFYKGCAIDAEAARDLSQNTLISSSMTLDKCANNCGAYSYFGAQLS